MFGERFTSLCPVQNNMAMDKVEKDEELLTYCKQFKVTSNTSE